MQKNRFVQQRMPADCAVATVAMFLGRSYEDIARHCTGAELVQYGLSWAREEHVCGLFKTSVEVVDIGFLDWKRAAILSVPSLNEGKGQTHSIYWDGKRAWDPQQGREGYAAYTNQGARQFAITAIRRA